MYKNTHFYVLQQKRYILTELVPGTLPELSANFFGWKYLTDTV